MRTVRPPVTSANDGDPTVEAAVSEFRDLVHLLRRSVAHRWARPDLSMTHLHLLMLLEAEGTVPMSRIADVLPCSLPNATGIVDRMEERGLVERVRDAGDRRVVLVRPTELGLEQMRELDRVRTQHVRDLIDSMSVEEQEVCLRAIRALRQAAERAETPAADRQRPPAATG